MATLSKKTIESLIKEATRRKPQEVRPKKQKLVEPTPQQMTQTDFHRFGRAYKRVPVIESMLIRKQITDREYELLLHYRETAHAAQDSEKNESSLSPEKIMGGGGGGHPIGGYIPKTCMCSREHLETARMERDMLMQWQLARAVAVDDISLTEWCIRQHGGRERYDGKGRFIAMVPVGEKNVVGEALRELKSAAGRIVK